MNHVEIEVRHYWRVKRVLDAAREGRKVEGERMPADEAIDELEPLLLRTTSLRLRTLIEAELVRWSSPAVIACLRTDSL